MQKIIKVSSQKHQELIDITDTVKKFVCSSGIVTGICNVYVMGATASIMIQENWDDSVQDDVIRFFSDLIPNGVWKHDEHDGNGDSHLKAGIIGPSETIPVVDGGLSFSRWQIIFVCDFDGPRKSRDVVITLNGS